MVRPRRKKLQENLVKTSISILEKVDQIHNRNRHLKRLHLYRDPRNKYYKLFVRIIDFLEEIRGMNKNPIEDMLYDYYMCIYDRFSRFGKPPSLANFSPSDSNKIEFEEFIHSFRMKHDEEYWMYELPKSHEIINIEIIPDSEDTFFIEV